MVRNGTAGDLTAWLDEAATSEIASFTRGLVADQAAVVAALTEPWFKGQTKGRTQPPEDPQTPDIWQGQHRASQSASGHCIMTLEMHQI
ncbi:hypothetical protein [Palleronia aestuarii]|uniref:hypothetical protein n=1 Tax=Palleronia aestuarii TaxID=568105 RepID=UPI001B877E62|nr:hypothetical protein [Palleronia aestuarii]